MYDVVVVGLGPAGSTAAYRLAKKGYKVLGLDKERFPRYKSCGGCISIKVERMFDFDIAPVVENTVCGVGFTYRSTRPIDILSDKPVGYNVMRDRFDNLLMEKAREAGVEIIEGCRVRGLNDTGGSVTVSCEGGATHNARFVIGADGAAGFTGREYFGLDPKEAAVSITSEVPYDRASAGWANGKLFIDFGSIPFGYGWIFPKNDYLSVGVAGSLSKIRGGIKDLFRSFVTSHDALKGLKLGRCDGWTVPLFYGFSRPLIEGRVLLAGDTGHLVDPFLGEGIYYAILTAAAAADAVSGALESSTSELSGYQGWLEREVYPEFKAAEMISDLVYRHQRLWYAMIEREPLIMQRFYDVIRGDESNRSFYEWVQSRVRSKPWRVLRSWIDSRRLPA
jgi:geranylgeranyl reductase family protein